MSYYSKLRNTVQAAVNDGIITQEQAQRILDKEHKDSLLSRLGISGMFSVIAGIFIAIGIITLISVNWSYIPDYVKIIGYIMFLMLTFEAYIRTENKKHYNTGLGVLLFFLPGAGIGLYGQIFQLSGEPAAPLILWGILSAPMMFINKSFILHRLLSVLILAVLFFFDGGVNDNPLNALDSISLLLLSSIGLGINFYRKDYWSFPILMWLLFLLIFAAAHQAPIYVILSAIVLWFTFIPTYKNILASFPFKVFLVCLFCLDGYNRSFSSENWLFGHSGVDNIWTVKHQITLIINFIVAALVIYKGKISENEILNRYFKAAIALAMFPALFSNIVYMIFHVTAISTFVFANFYKFDILFVGTLLIINGYKLNFPKQINWGFITIMLLAVICFGTLFGSLLQSGLGFITAGIIFAAIAHITNKMRKQLIEASKNEIN